MFDRLQAAGRCSVIVLAAVLAACSDSSDNSQSTSTVEPTATTPATQATGDTATSALSTVKETGKIRVGYANEAPFAFMDSSSGRLTGEAPEVLRHVMKQLGVSEIEGVLTEFGSLIPGLQANRFDVIAAGMYITPERCKQVVFSNPTYGIGSAFIVAEGNPKSLHSFEDVAGKTDARLGVVVGAIESDYAKASGVTDDQIVVFPDAASAMAGVVGNRVDAYAATALTVNDLLAKRSTGVERAEPFTDPVIDGKEQRGYGAFAFRQDDTDLRDAFNEQLASYLGSEAHLAVVKPFGFTSNELPGGVTAEQLCQG